jgi:hypothetical protein
MRLLGREIERECILARATVPDVDLLAPACVKRLECRQLMCPRLPVVR